MSIFLKSKVIRALALVPLGIGSVIGTIYLTNLNKPWDFLDSLEFKRRPEMMEDTLTPLVVVNVGGIDSGIFEGLAGAGKNMEDDSETEEDTPDSEEEDVSLSLDLEELGEDDEELEEEEEQLSEETEASGTEPELILKQAVENISQLDLSKVKEVVTLFWLFQNLDAATTAVKELRGEEPKKEEKTVQETTEQAKPAEKGESLENIKEKKTKELKKEKQKQKKKEEKDRKEKDKKPSKAKGKGDGQTKKPKKGETTTQEPREESTSPNDTIEEGPGTSEGESLKGKENDGALIKASQQTQSPSKKAVR